MESTEKMYLSSSDVLEIMEVCAALGYIDVLLPMSELKEKLQLMWNHNDVNKSASRSPSDRIHSPHHSISNETESTDHSHEVTREGRAQFPSYDGTHDSMNIDKELHSSMNIRAEINSTHLHSGDDCSVFSPSHLHLSEGGLESHIDSTSSDHVSLLNSSPKHIESTPLHDSGPDDILSFFNSVESISRRKSSPKKLKSSPLRSNGPDCLINSTLLHHLRQCMPSRQTSSSPLQANQKEDGSFLSCHTSFSSRGLSHTSSTSSGYNFDIHTPENIESPVAALNLNCTSDSVSTDQNSEPAADVTPNNTMSVSHLDSSMHGSLPDTPLNEDLVESLGDNSQIAVVEDNGYDIALDSSSEDEDNDNKLEQLFSQIKLQEKVKPYTSNLECRKSLSVFIVSDSEDLSSDIDHDGSDEVLKEGSDDQELIDLVTNKSISPSSLPPMYHTPHTPNMGIVFWGSPTLSSNFETGTAKKPLPVTPINKRPPIYQSLTTPSANKQFSRFKNHMMKENFELFNESVFENKLPKDTEVVWNNRLRSTAGYCYYLGTLASRKARIELSTKIVDSFERVQSTLVHEMCHAATWIIDGLNCGGHGKQWKAWAKKVTIVHPGVNPVTRCHSFEIHYKHNYKCVTCDFRIGRHSKSINLITARCPYCVSNLEYIPRLKVDGTPIKMRQLNKYAQYVKCHYSEVKDGSPWRSHKEVMEKVKELYHKEQ